MHITVRVLNTNTAFNKYIAVISDNVMKCVVASWFVGKYRT